MIEECILKKMEFKTILAESAKLPIVKNDRELFVRKELRGRYSQEIAEKEIQYNPTYAGINVEDIDKIAKSTIAAATKTITALFTVAGVGQNPDTYRALKGTVTTIRLNHSTEGSSIKAYMLKSCVYSGTTRIVTVDMFLREIGLFLWWFLWG